jgi:hypothetical protein
VHKDFIVFLWVYSSRPPFLAITDSSHMTILWSTHICFFFFFSSSYVSLVNAPKWSEYIGWKILNTRCNLTRTGPGDYVSYCVKRRKGLDYFHHQKLILSHWYCKNMWFTDKGKVFSLLLSRKKGTNMKQPRKKCHSSWEKKSIFKITYNGSHRGAKR